MSAMNALAERTVRAFREAHGRDPVVVAFAPGRVNLIGEHTDYNDGFALPCALDCGTVVALAPREDRRILARALDLGGETGDFALGDAIPVLETGHWQNHLRGIAAGLPQFGLPVCGADLVISGDIPQGTGLSSSASLGVALALGLTALAGESAPDPRTLARVAQWSEHNYVGCACGLMDQIASAFGQAGHALLLDCRSLEVRPVQFPADAAILIVNSGVTRGLVDSAYNERRAQCAAAAAHYGVAALRDLDLAQLEAGRGDLDDITFRRARHVVSENARTEQAAKAMERGDLVTLGVAMRASHASLRDDFEVSVPPVDALVDFLNGVIGQSGGARMTGGGFGGCVVAVMPQAMIGDAKLALKGFWSSIGSAPQLSMVARPAGGARLMAL
ncbi:MAG: galactokinase [Novosphingobium sp.]|nr:galactokinase [Novosphingobium sp.]